MSRLCPCKHGWTDRDAVWGLGSPTRRGTPGRTSTDAPCTIGPTHVHCSRPPVATSSTQQGRHAAAMRAVATISVAKRTSLDYFQAKTKLSCISFVMTLETAIADEQLTTVKCMEVHITGSIVHGKTRITSRIRYGFAKVICLFQQLAGFTTLQQVYKITKTLSAISFSSRHAMAYTYIVPSCSMNWSVLAKLDNTIWKAVMCAWKLTEVSLIYCTEPKNRKSKRY